MSALDIGSMYSSFGYFAFTSFVLFFNRQCCMVITIEL